MFKSCGDKINILHGHGATRGGELHPKNYEKITTQDDAIKILRDARSTEAAIKEKCYSFQKPMTL
jgi:hypothetical protein